MTNGHTNKKTDRKIDRKTETATQTEIQRGRDFQGGRDSEGGPATILIVGYGAPVNDLFALLRLPGKYATHRKAGRYSAEFHDHCRNQDRKSRLRRAVQRWTSTRHHKEPRRNHHHPRVVGRITRRHNISVRHRVVARSHMSGCYNCSAKSAAIWD